MALRNFWVEADIDGRKTKLAGGPRSKDGGMSIRLYQRCDGAKRTVLDIDCYVTKDGDLETNISSWILEKDEKYLTRR